MIRLIVAAALLLGIAPRALLAAEEKAAKKEREQVLVEMERAREYSLELAVKGVERDTRLRIKDVRGDVIPFVKKTGGDEWTAEPARSASQYAEPSEGS